MWTLRAEAVNHAEIQDLRERNQSGSRFLRSHHQRGIWLSQPPASWLHAPTPQHNVHVSMQRSRAHVANSYGWSWANMGGACQCGRSSSANTQLTAVTQHAPALLLESWSWSKGEQPPPTIRLSHCLTSDPREQPAPPQRLKSAIYLVESCRLDTIWWIRAACQPSPDNPGGFTV